jgi:alkanesulfonate monooxygenase SsuD/methylene tetrahydromethanopterin reductase-like flavin-dependent oxidoreductase (luciferase family)
MRCRSIAAAAHRCTILAHAAHRRYTSAQRPTISQAAPMKASLFCTARYMGPTPQGVWPLAGAYCSPETAARSMQTTLDQFRCADEFGFDWVTVAEHHYSGFSLTPNPMVLAGALTQIVRRARIAVLGPTIPILNPVRVAEEFAMLDAMTGGRVVAGMMRGTPNEYVTYNINPSESRARFAEALEIIRRAWTEPQPFGWQGRYYQYRTISIWPRPVQQPHPPIYMSGSSPEAGEYAAQNRIGLGFAFTTVPLAAKAVRHFRDQARRAGWEPVPEDVMYRIGFYVAETDAEAFADMSAAPPRVSLTDSNAAINAAIAETDYYGRDAAQRSRTATRELRDRIEQGQILVGSPDTVVKQIKRIRDELGAGILDCTLAVQLGDKTLRSIELFGTRVLPKIREL